MIEINSTRYQCMSLRLTRVRSDGAKLARFTKDLSTSKHYPVSQRHDAAKGSSLPPPPNGSSLPPTPRLFSLRQIIQSPIRYDVAKGSSALIPHEVIFPHKCQMAINHFFQRARMPKIFFPWEVFPLIFEGFPQKQFLLICLVEVMLSNADVVKKRFHQEDILMGVCNTLLALTPIVVTFVWVTSEEGRSPILF